MPILNRIAGFHAEMTEWRQDLHRHPETAFDEHRTAGIVAEKLRSFGVDEVHTGIAGTGVVGVIRGQGAGGRAIGLRADMDALHIHEETGAPHASTIPGKMHACGHDGHTTMLLGAARYLAETRNFDGTVYVIFQPAEENEGGAEVMIKEGLFERFPVDEVFGLHNWPGAPAGTFIWKDGPVMAAVANIEIVVTGKGAHGAMPHMGIDPIFVASQIVSGLQGIVSREVEAVDGAVVSITSIAGGDTYNVIPERVKMLGTTRWFAPEIGDLIETRVQAIPPAIAQAFGATAEVKYRRKYPATINHTAPTERTRRAAETVAGTGRVIEKPKPTMGAEDFAFMLNERPGSYIMMGSGKGASDASLHHPRYDFNDEVLPVGASYWATLAEQILARGA